LFSALGSFLATYKPRTCFLEVTKLRVWVYSQRRLAQVVVESFLKQGFGRSTDLFKIIVAGNGLLIVDFLSHFVADLLRKKLFYNRTGLILFTYLMVEEVGGGTRCCLLFTPEQMMFEAQGNRDVA
jgi:hypothetical protein